MENEMETTIKGLGFRVLGFRVSYWGYRGKWKMKWKLLFRV